MDSRIAMVSPAAISSPSATTIFQTFATISARTSSAIGAAPFGLPYGDDPTMPPTSAPAARRTGGESRHASRRLRLGRDALVVGAHRLPGRVARRGAAAQTDG